MSSSSRTVHLALEPAEARALHHSIAVTLGCMDAAAPIPADAPLYGWYYGLVEIAQRLDHEINHATPGGAV